MAKRGRPRKVAKKEAEPPKIEEKEEKQVDETEIRAKRAEDNAEKARGWLKMEQGRPYRETWQKGGPRRGKYPAHISIHDNIRRWRTLGIEYMAEGLDVRGNTKTLPEKDIERAVAAEKALCISVLPEDEQKPYVERAAIEEEMREKAEAQAKINADREEARRKDREDRAAAARRISTGGAGLDLEICEVPEGGVPVVSPDVPVDPEEEPEVERGDMPDLQYEVN